MRRFLTAILVSVGLLVTGASFVSAQTPVPAAPAAGSESTSTNRFVDSIYKAVDKTAEKSKAYQTGGEGGLTSIIGGIIRTMIGFLGVAAVGLFIYAGYLWMTAGGNDDQVSQAKSIMKQVVIGFIVLSLAYGIVSYVFYAISVAGGTAK